MDDIAKVLFSDEPNIIKGNYTKDETKASEYIKAIRILEDLQKRNGEDYSFAFRASDVTQPLYVHTIEIRWISEEATFEPPKLLADALSKVDHFHFSREQLMNDTWLLSSEIYTEAEE